MMEAASEYSNAFLQSIIRHVNDEEKSQLNGEIIKRLVTFFWSSNVQPENRQSTPNFNPTEHFSQAVLQVFFYS